MDIKNLKVVAASLCLSAILVTGCGNEIENENILTFGNYDNKIELSYENGIPEGIITYENLDLYVKIVTVNIDDANKSLLMIKNQRRFAGSMRMSNIRAHEETEYVDLKSGITIIDYYDYIEEDREDFYLTGENITIVKEKNITEYLIEYDFVKKEYTYEEIIDFYDEKIKPNLDLSEKELVKWEKK